MARVVIAAGGTAGHVVPALAVADELRDRGARVSFIGAAGRIEGELVPAAGYELETLELTGISRTNPLRAARAVWRAMRGVPAARAILRARSADAVLGGGGYVAGTVGAAAVLGRVPLVLTEADRHLGLANRLLARRARTLCLAFDVEGVRAPRTRVTGRPVPREVGTADRERARRRFGIAGEDGCVLVFGGSLGARSINLAALDAFAGPGPRDFHVLHITGSRDHAEARARVARARPERYTLVEYERGMADALAAGDLAVARAGGSVFELAAAGRPAILIPYPHAAGDHQAHNARWMAEAGGAVVLDDAELSGESLGALASRLMGDPERLERMAARARSLARPRAAADVADEVLAACDP